MVYVIGVGPSKVELLTKEARDLIVNTSVVVAPLRIANELKSLRADIASMEITDTLNFVKAHQNEDVAILASGDVGFYSISSMVTRVVENVTLINGLSSMQYFAGLLGIKYDDAYRVSLHGRNKYLIGAVTYNSKVFALTGGENKAHTLIKQLFDFGLEDVEICVGENLSMSNQRIVKGSVKELLDYTFDDLSVMFITNNNATNPSKRLKDEDFVRARVPMTKEAVRTLAVSYLDVKENDIVYDVGAGTGSCSIALAMKAKDGVVFAIEKNPEAVELIHENKKVLGAYNIKVVEGYAPTALEELEAPNKVFIGGSSGNIRSIVELCLKKNDKIEVLITAIALESIGEGVKVLEELGFEVEVTSISAARSHKVGSYTMMKGENPIYIIKGGLKVEE